MTNEEAKTLFEQDLKDGKCSDDCPECNARELVIAALEKQIPKKPILDTIFPSGIKWWRCPVCEYHTITEVDRFCHNCGQALSFNSNGGDTE